MIPSRLQQFTSRRRYWWIASALVLLTLSIPWLFWYTVMPAYKGLMIEQVLDEARRVSKHVSGEIDFTSSDAIAVDVAVREQMRQFQIHKINYYDADARVLYSNDVMRIGSHNHKPYFLDHVAQGHQYYKVKSAGQMSSEGVMVHRDLLEIYTPLMEGHEFIGAFELYYDISNEMYKFNQLSRQMLFTVSVLSACLLLLGLPWIYWSSIRSMRMARYQRQLRELAERDSLTNLYNRRYFYALADDLLLSSKMGQTHTVGVLQLEPYDQLLKRYGRLKVEQLLEELAEKLTSVVNRGDILARYSDGQLIVLLANTSMEQGKQRLQSVCQQFAGDSGFGARVHAGISEYQPGVELELLIEQAELALSNSSNSQQLVMAWG